MIGFSPQKERVNLIEYCPSKQHLIYLMAQMPCDVSDFVCMLKESHLIGFNKTPFSLVLLYDYDYDDELRLNTNATHAGIITELRNESLFHFMLL